MLKIIDYILSGIVMSSSVLYMLSKLSGNKMDLKSWKTYVVFVLLGTVQILNYHFMNGYIKMVLITMFVIFLYYYYFKKDKKEAVITTIYTQLINLLSEFIFSCVMILIFGSKLSKVISLYKNIGGIFVINLIISITSILFVNQNLIQKFYRYLILIAENMKEKIIIILMVFVMITINIVYGSTFYKINTEYLLIINVILLLIYFYIVIKILNEKDRYIRISSKYNVTISSLHELHDVVSILKMKGHENRNQLQTIRNMIKKKDKDTIEYIDALIGDKLKDDEKLRVETSIITNSEISSLVYSKMITMKDKGINALLHVDKAVEKLNLYDLDDIMTLYICKIIGVWLDNAIEAVSKLENKKIEIHMYVDFDNNLNLTISNNCEEDIDLELINKEGYTTKGNEHGYGLSLVRDIVDKNKKIVVDTKFKNNIFTQHLKVKM